MPSFATLFLRAHRNPCELEVAIERRSPLPNTLLQQLGPGRRGPRRREVRFGLRVAAGRDGDGRFSLGRQLVEDARLWSSSRGNECAELFNLGLEHLQTLHLAAQTDDLLDELRDVSLGSIQTVYLVFYVALCAGSIVL